MAAQVVELPEIERLTPLIIRVLGGNPGKFTLQGTNTYVVGTGHRRLLVDTGEGKQSWSRALSSVLSSERATISHVLITHWHPDHVGGVNDLLSLCPNAQIHKHKPTAGQVDIEDGQLFQTEGATLRAFHCPGHTIDHMALVFEEEDAIFTGDNVLGHGTAVFEDLPLYLDSLRRMEQQFTGRAYPAHGGVITDGRARIEEYIKHRQRREDEILLALRNAVGTETDDGNEGGFATTRIARRDIVRTPKELVKIIYQNVPLNLHDAAEKGVVQVLQKLHEDGKVAKADEDGKWQIAE